MRARMVRGEPGFLEKTAVLLRVVTSSVRAAEKWRQSEWKEVRGESSPILKDCMGTVWPSAMISVGGLPVLDRMRMEESLGRVSPGVLLRELRLMANWAAEWLWETCRICLRTPGIPLTGLPVFMRSMVEEPLSRMRTRLLAEVTPVPVRVDWKRQNAGSLAMGAFWMVPKR